MYLHFVYIPVNTGNALRAMVNMVKESVSSSIHTNTLVRTYVYDGQIQVTCEICSVMSFNHDLYSYE